MSVFLSVSMVLSLLPAQGVEEARSEFLLATTAAPAEENLGKNTDPGGGNDPNNTPAGGEAQESPVPEQNTNENQNDDDQNNTDGNVADGNDTNGDDNQ